jgi:Flp pilus assembly protein TadD
LRIALAIVVLAVPAAAVLWWYVGPAYQRSHPLSQAQEALDAGDLDQAEMLLGPLLRDKSAGYRSYLLYANVLRRRGQVQQAWLSLSRATQLGLPEIEGRREQALLQAVQEFSRTEQRLQQLLQERPNDVEVLQTLAAGFARSRRWHEAERAYSRWLEVEPDRQDVLFGRGQALLGAGSFDLAAADFREILRRSPQHFSARLLLSHCLLSIGRDADAEAELIACRRLDPSRPDPLVGLATCCMERGDLNCAQDFLKQALELAPTDARALHLLGDLYLRRQRYDLAIPVFEQVLRMHPREPLAHLKLAQALDQSGDRERAKQHEQRYQQLTAESREPVNGMMKVRQ